MVEEKKEKEILHKVAELLRRKGINFEGKETSSHDHVYLDSCPTKIGSYIRLRALKGIIVPEPHNNKVSKEEILTRIDSVAKRIISNNHKIFADGLMIDNVQDIQAVAQEIIKGFNSYDRILKELFSELKSA